MRKIGPRFQSDVASDCPVPPECGPATVLIPEELREPLQRLLVLNGGTINRLLRNLLEKYAPATRAGQLDLRGGFRTLYQARGRRLHRRVFRPNGRDWLELGQLAGAYGVSRCLLFVYLLEVECGHREPERSHAAVSRVELFDLRLPDRIRFQWTWFPGERRVRRSFQAIPMRGRRLNSVDRFGLRRLTEADSS